MTEMSSYMIENPKFESYKPKKRCYYSSSIFLIFLSIFTFIMIFYVFQVSPSSIFNNTKVLFFISNTLILIIAADYGAFTHKESHDFYSEYSAAASTMRSRTNNYSPIPVLEQVENRRAEEIKNPKEEESIVKDIVCVTHPEKTVGVVSEEKPKDVVAVEVYKPVKTDEACNTRKDVSRKPYGRSQSDRPRRVRRISDESSKWMVVPEKWENVKEESEEFSKMSNEELNRRVEDFIQRFNRDIRLQSRVSPT